MLEVTVTRVLTRVTTRGNDQIWVGDLGSWVLHKQASTNNLKFPGFSLVLASEFDKIDAAAPADAFP